MVYFILWPFHYIHGFHVKQLNDWVADQQHPPWEVRVEILKSALKAIGNSKLQVLLTASDWYKESEAFFEAENERSYFWTGTWYVIRKFQAYFKAQYLVEPKFYFICGADQFNPNIQSLLFDAGVEKVWCDYSIAEHLALHNVYALPRKADASDLEFFSPACYLPNEVIFGTPILNVEINATLIRSGKLSLEELYAYTPSGAAEYILKNEFWGYTLPTEKHIKKRSEKWPYLFEHETPIYK